MTAFVAITDRDWFDFLVAREDVDEGCILLVEPFFWPRELLIPQPADWKRNTVRGRTYDLAAEPGRSLWRAVAERLHATPSPAGAGRGELGGGWSDPAPGRRRLGQGKVQADNPVHELANGLLPRSDVHRLFDAGYITVTPDYHVEASRRMRDDFNDGENYLALHGRAVRVPRAAEMRPGREALVWHNENRFRG